MIYPFKKVLYDCKQATKLSIKKEEGSITSMERLKLWYHLLYCDPCRRFIAQWKTLGNAAHRHDPVSASLSTSAREKLQQQIDAAS